MGALGGYRPLRLTRRGRDIQASRKETMEGLLVVEAQGEVAEGFGLREAAG